MARKIVPDTITAGSGPVTLLIHSSVSGARQWRRLMQDLAPRHHLIAVNLYGYGRTPPWPEQGTQRLADQARLVLAALPDAADDIRLVGHSFGGAVAMKAAEMLGPRADRLVLLEPNPFHLLAQNGRDAAFAEALGLADTIRSGAAGDWLTAARVFADYWIGPGSWAAMPEDRRAAFAEALRPNLHEWDAVLSETAPTGDWIAALPRQTLLAWSPDTVRTIREIAGLLAAAAPHWRTREVPQGGHMAPLTHPDQVNPMIAEFLDRP